MDGAPNPVPNAVARFRAEFRTHIGPRYSGRLHFACTTIVLLCGLGFALRQLVDVQPRQWLTLPVAFLVANLVEYTAHRWPMHHRWVALGALFRRHTLQHHRFYVEDAMAIESHRDIAAVMFPAWVLLLFLGGIATPLAALLHMLISPNIGWLFMATAVAYFLLYEWLHLAYHLPKSNPVGRMPPIQRLCAHHTHHHDPSRMVHDNFNITFPIFDALFRTARRPAARGDGDR